MKRIAALAFIFLFVLTLAAYAEEAPISPFIGTWSGRWSDPTGQKKETYVGTLKLKGNGQGGVMVESWETGTGKKLNLKNPPKIVQDPPNEILILWPNGDKTTLKLEGSIIKAENNPVGGRPWFGTFFKEKE
jgi:hypothetical protein